jgi:hypothetical protein
LLIDFNLFPHSIKFSYKIHYIIFFTKSQIKGSLGLVCPSAPLSIAQLAPFPALALPTRKLGLRQVLFLFIIAQHDPATAWFSGENDSQD